MFSFFAFDCFNLEGRGLKDVGRFLNGTKSLQIATGHRYSAEVDCNINGGNAAI